MGVLDAVLGVGGIASNLLTNSRNQSNNDRNYELALRQQQFAEDSFKKQMHFNSPVTQAALMRAAGINPALGGSGLAGSVSTGTNGGIPSNSPMMPIDLNGLAATSKGIALNDAEKDKTQSEVRLNHLKAIADDFNNFLLTTYGESLKKGELDESVSRTQRNFNEALLALAEGDVARAEEKLKKAEEFATYAKGGRDEAERYFINTEIYWYAARVRSLIRQQNASAYRDTQEGNLSALDYKIKNDPDVIVSLRQRYHDESNKLQQEGKLTKKQAEMVDTLIDKYMKENNSYYLRLCFDYLTEWGKLVPELLMLRKRVAAFEALSDAAQQNASTRARKQDFDENSYSTTQQFDAKGHLRGTHQTRRRRR